MKRLLSFLFLFAAAASAQTSHTLPTLDRNNAWTGTNTYIAGKLQLGTNNQICTASGTYMTGFTDTFVPICQSLSALGVTSINGTTGIITLANGTNITIVQSPAGTFTFNCTSCGASGGVITLNGLNGVVTLTAGTGIAITQTSGTNLTISNTGGGGGGGSGTVSPGSPYQVPQYDSTTNTQINPVTTLFSLNSSMTLSQINTLIASLNCGTNCQSPPTATIIVPDGVAQLPWTNATSTSGSGNAGTTIEDIRMGAQTTPLSTWGVSCGVNGQGTYNLTQGSTDVSASFTLFSAADIGSTIVTAFTPASGVSVQTSFTPTITDYNSGNGHVTISTASPVTGSFGGYRGYLNTTNFQNAMQGLGQGGKVGQLPAGCGILTGPIQWNAGQSLVGQASGSSFIYGLPGLDIFMNPDAAGQGSVTRGGMVFGHLTLIVNDYIDAAKPWNWNQADGTVVSETPLYRPLGTNSPAANDPLAPGWAQGSGVYNGGATNGVASITQNSAVICVPASLGRMPVVGQQIVFRDTPTIFQSIVSSLSGGGCSSGFNPATMASALPNTSGYTIAQAEWVSTTSIQNLGVAISAGSITYPKTITLTNSTAINPGFESNFATHGRIKMGNEEYDYLGGANGITGPWTIVLQDGPTTTVGWGVGTAVVPENPCYAKYETPWPVIPTVNSGDATPAGAVFFPAWCAGNAAIAMPAANGNVYRGTGFSNAYLQDVGISSWANSQSNNVTGYYAAGNNPSYGTTYDRMSVIGTEYGIVQGPASVGQHGVGPVGPTSEGNHYRDLTLRNAVNYIFVDMQNSSVDRVDAYTTFINPYDNTTVGAYTAFGMGFTLDEQNGAFITFTFQNMVNSTNSEPENGTHAEIPPYAYFDCFQCEFHNNNFEGVPTYLGGSGQLVEGGSLAVPSVNYGQNNTVRFVNSISSGNLNGGANGFAIGVMTNFGQEFNMTSQYGFGGVGPNLWGTNYTRASLDGQTDQFAYMGNFTAPPVATAGSMLYPDEFAISSNLEANPMTSGAIYDPTALVTGQYISCTLNSSKTSCNTSHFNGNNFISIGPQNRIPADKTLLSMLVRNPAGSSFASSNLLIAANAAGSCGGGVLLNTTIHTPTTAWTPIELPVDFTGMSGCSLNIQMSWTTYSGEFDYQYFDFLPTPTRILLRNASPTIASACAVNGEFLGSDAANLYMCESGAVVNLPFGGGGGGGITAGTGDTTFSGSGTVATTTGNINGGTPFKSQPAGVECNTGATGQLTPCTNISVVGPISYGVYVVPTSATPVFDISQGNTQILTLSANTTTTLTGGSSRGQDLNFEIYQPASGGPFTFNWPTNFFGFPAVQSGASGYTSARGFWDGTNVIADGYNSTLCLSGTSPAACGNASKGFVAIPAGTASTVVVNTTALGPSSVVLVEGDEQVTLPGVSCSASDPSGPIKTSARNSGVSFTLQAPGTLTGSYCIGWVIVNP